MQLFNSLHTGKLRIQVIVMALLSSNVYMLHSTTNDTFYRMLKRLGESFLETNYNAPHHSSSSIKSKNVDRSVTANPSNRFLRASVLFLAGAGAGIISTVSTYPFDIMRTQFALQDKNPMFPTMNSFIINTLKTKGVSGFYAGLTPAVIGITPYMGLNFVIYEMMKLAIIKTKLPSLSISITTDPSSSTSSHNQQGILPNKIFHNMKLKYAKEINQMQEISQKFLCGAVAGGVSKFAVYPLDTIKKRLQAQVLSSSLNSNVLNSKLPHYNGVIDCFQKIVKMEGYRGLYRVNTIT